MHRHFNTELLTPVASLTNTSGHPASKTSPPRSSTPEKPEPNPSYPLNQQISSVVDLSGHEAELADLKARDREVRAHEAAHAAAAGALTTGGPQFTFQRGSDGRLYAVAGEVNIDTSPVAGDPQSTIQKAQRIRSAALAPANPSAQDRSVAAQADRMEAQARRELQQERTQQIQDITSSKFTQSVPAPPILDLFA